MTFSLLKDGALTVLGGGKGVVIINYMVGVEVLTGVLIAVLVKSVKEFMFEEQKDLIKEGLNKINFLKGARYNLVEESHDTKGENI